VFSGVVLDPDSLTPVGATIQCKVTVYFAESVPALTTIGRFHSNLNNVSCLTSVSSGTGTGTVILSASGISHTV
jgi:hypothetical protein